MSTALLTGCALCATLGKTCCQRSEVLVTCGDVARIERHTERRDFWEYRVPSDPSYLDQPDDPNWLKWAFRPDGTRAILRRGPNGDCTFLTPAGCTLPLDVRPLVCRLYPYSYTEAGIVGVTDDRCPPAVIPPGRTILQVLDMRFAAAVDWHKRLYTELRTKEPTDEDRSDLRLAG